MRMTTQVWAELNNPGVPTDLIRVNGTAKEVITEIAKWVLGVTMMNNLRITVARNEEQLNVAVKRKNPSAEQNDIMSELEAILAESATNTGDE